MRYAWREFLTGWNEARRRSYLLLGFVPVALVVALIVDIALGRVRLSPPVSVGVSSGVIGVAVGFLLGRYGGKLRKGLTVHSRTSERGHQLAAGAKGGEARESSHRGRRVTD